MLEYEGKGIGYRLMPLLVYSGGNMKCDICKSEVLPVYVDGKTRMGPWANMCPICYAEYGIGLGEGLGQAYKLTNGKYLKINTLPNGAPLYDAPRMSIINLLFSV